MPIIVPPEQLGALRAGEATMQGQLAAAQLRQRGAEALGQGFAGFGQGIGQGLSAAARREQQDRQHKEEMAQRQKFWQDGLVAKGDAEYVYSPQNKKKVEALQNNLDLALQDDSLSPDQKQFMKELHDSKMQEIGPPNIFQMKEKPRLVAGLADGESREWRDPDTNTVAGLLVNQGGEIKFFPVPRSSAGEKPHRANPSQAASYLETAKMKVARKYGLIEKDKDGNGTPATWLLNDEQEQEALDLAAEMNVRVADATNKHESGKAEPWNPTSQPAVKSQEAAPVIMQKTLKNGTPVQVMVLPDGRYRVIGVSVPPAQNAPAAPVAPTAPQQGNYQSTHRER